MLVPAWGVSGERYKWRNNGRIKQEIKRQKGTKREGSKGTEWNNDTECEDISVIGKLSSRHSRANANVSIHLSCREATVLILVSLVAETAINNAWLSENQNGGLNMKSVNNNVNNNKGFRSLLDQGRSQIHFRSTSLGTEEWGVASYVNVGRNERKKETQGKNLYCISYVRT